MRPDIEDRTQTTSNWQSRTHQEALMNKTQNNSNHVNTNNVPLNRPHGWGIPLLYSSHSGVVRPTERTGNKPLPPLLDAPPAPANKSPVVDHSLGVSKKQEKLNSRGHPLIRMKKPNKMHLSELTDEENGHTRLPSINSLINTLHYPQETPSTMHTQEVLEMEDSMFPPRSRSTSTGSNTPGSPKQNSPKMDDDYREAEPTYSQQPQQPQQTAQTGMASATPVKKRTDIDHIIEKTHDMLPAKEDPKFFDITHLLTLPQADAAKAVRLSKPTFCKRWKEAVGPDRKWPHRYILKIDREIRQLKSQQKRLGDNVEISERLNALTLKRKIALTPTAIRL
eukprot:TRINITY_DN2355_c0_g1_i1.p1 TRINITY_DN2355_c0_g1~~TRINITY_DN2355_c0_g1_i1.p1  ORF type:complete len:337 (+),score=65.63 TRINITY_DN2355_c0_g1_i1:185-1195(+)